MNGQEKIEHLRKTLPHVAILVTRKLDPYFKWDGDGPDPLKAGFNAYDVYVKAVAVVDGKLVEGRSSLGGSYFQHGEPIGEVHGYLPQMVDEAVQELWEVKAAFTR